MQKKCYINVLHYKKHFTVKCYSITTVVKFLTYVAGIEDVESNNGSQRKEIEKGREKQQTYKIININLLIIK